MPIFRLKRNAWGFAWRRWSVGVALLVQFCTPESVLHEVLAIPVTSESCKSRALGSVIGEFMRAQGDACVCWVNGYCLVCVWEGSSLTGLAHSPLNSFTQGHLHKSIWEIFFLISAAPVVYK